MERDFSHCLSIKIKCVVDGLLFCIVQSITEIKPGSYAPNSLQLSYCCHSTCCHESSFRVRATQDSKLQIQAVPDSLPTSPDQPDYLALLLYFFTKSSKQFLSKQIAMLKVSMNSDDITMKNLSTKVTYSITCFFSEIPTQKYSIEQYHIKETHPCLLVHCLSWICAS